MIDNVRTKAKGVFYGWWIVTAGFFISAFGVGSVFYGFNTFFNPMVTEFGWSRTLMSGVFSLSRLEGGLEGPLAGWLVDKFGARRMLFIGVAITGAGFIMLRLVDDIVSLYLIFGLLISFGYNLGFFHTSTAAVAKWFVRKRGRALSILITGNGIGGAVLVPVIAWIILQFGWRWAATAIGLGMWVFVLPLGLIIRSTPEEMGLLPDGERGGQGKPSSETGGVSGILETVDEVNLGVRETLRTRSFWVYALAMTLRACILSAIVVHQIPHLTDIGIPYQAAASVLGLMVLMSVPGRFVFGWLGDVFNKKLLVFLLCLLQGVGLYIFIHASTMPLLYLFVVVYGLGYGGVIPLTIALRADLFGRRNYATIAGITMPLTMIGTVAAPVVAGYFHDVTQSYDLVFYIFMALIVAAGILFLLIPRTSR